MVGTTGAVPCPDTLVCGFDATPVGPRLDGLVIGFVGLGSAVLLLKPVDAVPGTWVGRRNDGVVAVVPTDPNLKVVELTRAGPVPVKLRMVFDVGGCVEAVVAEKRAVIVWLLVVGLPHSWLLQGTLTVLVWYTTCVDTMFIVVVLVCCPPPPCCCAGVVVEEELWLLLPSLTIPN